MRKYAVWMSDSDALTRVYPAQTRAQIAALVSELPGDIRRADFAARRADLQRAEVIFSTWGMPALSEAEIAEYLPNLRAVFYGAGSVQYFARPFLSRGVRVFSAWAANAVPVAEYAVAQIVLSGKGFYQAVRRYERQGREASSAYADSLPCNYGIRVGILGAGMIGRMVLDRLRAYACEVLAYDPFVSDEVLQGLGARRATLAEIFSTCQVVSNHVANLPSTVGMLDYALFSRMPRNATFLNTGRGAQVVEADLVRALQEAPDRTAVLDVTFPEPPAADSPLHALPNVFLTPHIAGSKGREVERMGAYMAEECARWLSGAPTPYEVTLPMLETMA